MLYQVAARYIRSIGGYTYLMKQFRCGDVVPGCTKTFTAASEDEILSAVAVHAREDHQLLEIPPSLVQDVRSRIEDLKVA